MRNSEIKKIFQRTVKTYLIRKGFSCRTEGIDHFFINKDNHAYITYYFNLFDDNFGIMKVYVGNKYKNDKTPIFLSMLVDGKKSLKNNEFNMIPDFFFTDLNELCGILEMHVEIYSEWILDWIIKGIDKDIEKIILDGKKLQKMPKDASSQIERERIIQENKKKLEVWQMRKFPSKKWDVNAILYCSDYIVLFPDI